MKYKKVVLLFPGQGSQHVGMGKEFYDKYKYVRDIYGEAGKILGYDIGDVCFKDHKFGKLMHRAADLNKTIYTQPTVLTTSYACYRVFEERCNQEGISLNTYLTAGHSLGEYTALLVSEAMDLETALRLVQKRATYMTDAGRAYPDAGLMAIVDKKKELDYDQLCTVCKDFGVFITLNNTKSQVVVGGSKKRLGDLSKKLKDQGKLGKLLKVEGPFHTPIMKPAANKFKYELEKYRLHIASGPIMANVSAEAVVDPIHIRKELFAQIYKIVNWKGSMERIIENGADLFIEIGPRKVLANMMKDINPSIKVLNVEDEASLDKTINELTQDELQQDELQQDEIELEELNGS